MRPNKSMTKSQFILRYQSAGETFPHILQLFSSGLLLNISPEIIITHTNIEELLQYHLSYSANISDLLFSVHMQADKE